MVVGLGWLNLRLLPQKTERGSLMPGPLGSSALGISLADRET